MIGFAPDWLSVTSLIVSTVVSVGMIILWGRKVLKDMIVDIMTELLATFKVQIDEVRTSQRLIEMRVAELERKQKQP